MLLFTWAALWMEIGNLFESSFVLLENIYNLVNPNKVFIFVAFVGVCGWLIRQAQLNKEAKQQGLLK